MRHEAGGRRQETGDRRQETGDRRQETGDRRQETGDRRQETGDRRQETGDRRQETGDRRQETGDRRQETGDRRQEARGKRQETRHKRKNTRDRVLTASSSTEISRSSIVSRFFSLSSLAALTRACSAVSSSSWMRALRRRLGETERRRQFLCQATHNAVISVGGSRFGIRLKLSNMSPVQL